MQELINVGDVLVNDIGEEIATEEVRVGSYGLLVRGRFNSGYFSEAYYPYELPPIKPALLPFYGWAARGEDTLPSGAKIGYVSLLRYDELRIGNLIEYDAEWERTIEQIRKEGGN